MTARQLRRTAYALLAAKKAMDKIHKVAMAEPEQVVPSPIDNGEAEVSPNAALPKRAAQLEGAAVS